MFLILSQHILSLTDVPLHPMTINSCPIKSENNGGKCRHQNFSFVHQSKFRSWTYLQPTGQHLVKKHACPTNKPSHCCPVEYLQLAHRVSSRLRILDAVGQICQTAHHIKSFTGIFQLKSLTSFLLIVVADLRASGRGGNCLLRA